MATIKDIEYLVKRFSEKYRHPDLPEINQSPIYSLKCQLETKIKADLLALFPLRVGEYFNSTR